ncbi:MAG: MoxR family ATPase, partial [Actinomycetota bacterium]|nr:MoxR family ATPase [Actinomycetota bacterium]
AVQRLRRLDMAKKPGVSETIDWARALDFLGANNLDPKIAEDTLGSVVKDRDDLQMVKESLPEVIRAG